MSVTTEVIAQRILVAVQARKLAPGLRLGEQALAMLFDCSRTLVREALLQLSTRGIVTVSARRGWYVITPSRQQAREALDARLVIEPGLLRQSPAPGGSGIDTLKAHLDKEHLAAARDDASLRSYLQGDFHVCLAQTLGNPLLAEILRDLTARTTLVSMRYRAEFDSDQSCQDHERIVAALERGDMQEAARLMHEHLSLLGSALRMPADNDPLAELRHALQPMDSSPDEAPSKRPSSSSPRLSSQLSDDSSYLGALL